MRVPFFSNKTILGLILLGILSVCTLQAQNIELSGQIISNGELEGIHVINKTSYRYTTTNQNGVFSIEAKLSDSLYFSSIQYLPKIIVVSANQIKSKSITVTLSESINALDEVMIGTILTGDLNSDISNSDAERPIDFYDLGIPGYTGPRMNLAERRLFEADAGPLIIGLGLNFSKLLNMMSGRTKMLKKHVALDQNKQGVQRFKDIIGPIFFKTHQLEISRRTEFYYFCADAPDFKDRCLGRSEVEVLEYMEEKLEKFKAANLSKN
ncbi:carboxypeptidase-like regulatory domain-containing protein [Flavobacteriaceae bacterium]|nr:carboxypeptidase-like regulatory domain-containing protein [Flavobacteriaceae bacterium]MDC1472457.1 carboxypeptidase-like regulatory domain-containing protein [Flavobacteriaceae bacterium]MDC1539097.1 carboxypeptidase-like regulatory domain-containing protein [Flavobacteriaceae bacterium]